MDVFTYYVFQSMNMVYLNTYLCHFYFLLAMLCIFQCKYLEHILIRLFLCISYFWMLPYMVFLIQIFTCPLSLKNVKTISIGESTYLLAFISLDTWLYVDYLNLSFSLTIFSLTFPQTQILVTLTHSLQFKFNNAKRSYK